MNVEVELWIAFQTFSNMIMLTDWDWMNECQFVLEHSTHIRSLSNEFEERSKKMKNDFEKTLKEKNQVLIWILTWWWFLANSYK